MSKNYSIPADAIAVFETLPHLYLILSKELIILTASDAYLAATNKTRGEIKGKSLFTAFPRNPDWPETDGGIAYSLQQVLYTRKPHQLKTTRFDVADSTGTMQERHWHTAHKPVLSPAGEIQYIIHHTEDVSERVITERQLTTSLEKETDAAAKAAQLSRQLEKLFLEIPAQIAIVAGENMVYEFVNPQYKEELFPNREILGKPLLEALPEVAGEPIWDILNKVYRTGETVAVKEIYIPLADETGGQLKDHYFDLVYQPIRDINGEVVSVLSFKYEITEQVLSSKRIEQSETKLRLLNDELAQANEEIQAASEEIRSANEELSATNEDLYRAHESLTKLNNELEERVELRTAESVAARAESENQRDRFRFLLNAIPQQVWTANPEGALDYVNEVVCADFGQTHEEIVGHGWQAFIHPDDLQNCLQRWTNALQTGTEYMVEFRLRFKDGGYRWHLARAVPLIEDGEVKLWVGTNTNIEIQKNNEQKKDEFLSIASHELKTPLTSIKAFNQLMQRIGDPNKVTDFIQKSATHITRLEKLINDLLDVTRINAGKIDYNMEPFSIGRMITDAVESVQYTAPTHKIIIEDIDDATYTGDHFRLEQVVNNLLTNAIKYSPEGENVIVNCKTQLGNLVISVQDFGIGIERENLNRLFDRYYRVDNTAMRFEGLGLGLFISSEIIKRHNGAFWIESEPGKGSTFYFSLPLNIDKH